MSPFAKRLTLFIVLGFVLAMPVAGAAQTQTRFYLLGDQASARLISLPTDEPPQWVYVEENQKALLGLFNQGGELALLAVESVWDDDTGLGGATVCLSPVEILRGDDFAQASMGGHGFPDSILFLTAPPEFDELQLPLLDFADLSVGGIWLAGLDPTGDVSIDADPFLASWRSCDPMPEAIVQWAIPFESLEQARQTIQFLRSLDGW